MKAPDWKQFRFHLYRNPLDHSAGNQTGWLPWLIQCQGKRMERMPKAWESRHHHDILPVNSKSVTHGGVTGSVCDVCVCEWATQPLKRAQQWCWFIMRAWENVFSETFLSTSTNSWWWAFCLNQKCHKGGPNGFLLKRSEILCILCGIGSLWKNLKTIMLPDLSFKQSAWLFGLICVTGSQPHPQNGNLLSENVVFLYGLNKDLIQSIQ